MAAVQNKRKRESHEMASGRTAPGVDQSGEFVQHYLQGEDDLMSNSDFAVALAQHEADSAEQQDSAHMQGQPSNGQANTDTAAAAIAQYHTMTVPQSTEQSFMTQKTPGGAEGPNSPDQGDSSMQRRTSSFGDFGIGPTQSSPNGDTSPTVSAANNAFGGGSKPAVGSEEWHKVRKDNHKEVERRRRETINEGINELAKIVPGCEKNKGNILNRAVLFINQLKDNETQNIEKWTLEKLLTEQAIAELSTSCDKLKAECQRAWAECEQWKKAAQKAGVSIDGDKDNDADAEDAD